MYLILNKLFAGFFVLMALLWCSQLNMIGALMGGFAAAIAWTLWLRYRWAYFVAAAWCFGMLRTAMDKENTVHIEFGAIKSALMLCYFAGMAVAILLHEKVAIKRNSSSGSSSTKDQPPP